MSKAIRYFLRTWVAVLALSLAALTFLWVRSSSAEDMYDVRLTSSNIVEFQTREGSLIIQTVHSSVSGLGPAHLFQFDTMPVQPLPGTARFSFLGFSIRDFKFRFMPAAVKMFIIPLWFIGLGLLGSVALLFLLLRRKAPKVQSVAA